MANPAEAPKADRRALAKQAVPGVDVAAILLMLLDEDAAADILRQLTPDDVRKLGAAMVNVADAQDHTIDRALAHFVTETRCVSALAAAAEPRIRNVMTAALGKVRADNILAEIAPQTSAATLDLLRWMETDAIAKLIAEEHPQVGAIILAVLTPDVAAEILSLLPETQQTDLVYRAARLDTVSAGALAELEALLNRTSDQADREPGKRIGGKSDVARIFNNLKRPVGERVLKSVKRRDKQLGQEIEDEMFIFDNLSDLDDKALGLVLRNVDASILALALKGADGILVDRMLATMSARAADGIRDQMAESGLVKRVDVEEAQKQVILVVRQLADDGTIILGGGGDDYV